MVRRNKDSIRDTGQVEHQVTLLLAGRPLTFCMPPHSPLPKPGPCPKGHRTARKIAKAVAAPRPTGAPKKISPADFEKRFTHNQRLYRGVKSAAGADATRQGQLGDGDYGRAIYTGRLSNAQGYSGHGDQGHIMRMAVDPAAKAKIRVVPEKVRSKGSQAIEQWAADNDLDGYSTDAFSTATGWRVQHGAYLMIRNPAVLVVDEHNYTGRESVVLDFLESGYRMPSGYQPEIDNLRRLLKIPIPDEGKSFKYPD